MTQRFWLITVSVAGHLVLGLGLFVTNVWRLDQLDRERAQLPTAPLALMEEASGSPAAAPAQQLHKKQPKPIVKEPVQPTVKPPDPVVSVATLDHDVTGTGTGSGTGSGSGRGSAITDGGCEDPPCGESKAKPVVESKQVETPILIPPTALKELRIDGETQVHPSDTDKTSMLREDRSKSVGMVKVCVGTTGAVTSATIVASTHYADYDARLIQAVQRWHYRPFLVGGAPAPVCGMVQFVYVIKS